MGNYQPEKKAASNNRGHIPLKVIPYGSIPIPHSPHTKEAPHHGKYKESLHSDARQLTIYARTSPYISRAFYHIFGKKLLEEGCVDCSYVLKALGKGSYYSRLNSQGSNLYKLYAKSCMTSENIEITLEYLEAIAGNQDRNLSPLEEEALVYWIFLPYTSTNTPKREKRKNTS